MKINRRRGVNLLMQSCTFGLALLVDGCASVGTPAVSVNVQAKAEKVDAGGICHAQPAAYSIAKFSIQSGGMDDFLGYVEGRKSSVVKYRGNVRASTLGRQVQPEVVEAYHGSVLSTFKPAGLEVMEIYQWPCVKAFSDWYDSSDYAPWKKLQHSVSTAQLIVVEGLKPDDPAEHWPPAYSVVDVDVSVPSVFFGKYVPGHQGSVQKFGGTFLVAGNKVQTIEGSWKPRLVVMHRFPSIQLWKEWYDSTDYAPWKPLRHGSSRADVMLMEGLKATIKQANSAP